MPQHTLVEQLRARERDGSPSLVDRLRERERQPESLVAQLRARDAETVQLEPETTPASLGEQALSFGKGLVFPVTEAAAFSRSAATESPLLLPFQIARGLGSTLLQGMRALPDIGRNLLDPEARGATVRGFGEGLLESAAGERELPKAERVGRAVSTIGTLLAPGIPKGLRGLRQTRAARAAAPGIVQRAAPPTPISRQLAAAPDDVVRVLEQRAAANAAAGRVAAQEAADRSLAAQRAARQSRTPSTAPAGATATAVGGSPAQGVRVAPTPSGVRSGASPAVSVDAPGIPSGSVRAGMVFNEPTSGRLHMVIDVAPDGRLLVAPTGRVPGTRQPSFFIEPSDANALNFAVPRRGAARAFPEGPAATTIQGIKRGLESESGRARLGPLAVVGAGGAGAAAGVALGEPGDELINALIGGTAGAGAALGALRGVRPRTVPRRAPGQPTGRQRLAQGGLLTGRQRLIQGGLDARREIFLSGLALPQNAIAANTVLPRAALLTGSLAPLRGVPRMLAETTRAVIAPKSTLRRRGLRDIRLEETRRNVGPFSQRIGAVDAVAEAELRARVPGITQEQINALLVKTPLSTSIGQTPGTGGLVNLLKSKVGQGLFPFQRTAADISVGGFHDLRQLLSGGPVQGQLGRTARNRLLTASNVAAGAALGEVLEPDLGGLTTLTLLKAILGRGAVPLAAGAIMTGGRRFGRGLIPAPDVALDVGQFFPTSPEDIGAVRVFNQLRGRR